MKTWEIHFKNLLNAPSSAKVNAHIERVFDTFSDIPSGEFSQSEIDERKTKNGKAPELDGLPPEFCKLLKAKKSLRKFCNNTYTGNRPNEWGTSGITQYQRKET